MVPPPIAMLEMITELWAAQAITAAADLGIADALAKGPLSAAELASAVDADAARIDDPCILAEWSEQLSVLSERQQLAVTRTVRA